MLIPGLIVSLVTFPGVIVHEIGHQFFCRLCRVAVLEVKYFRFGNPAGYVIHEEPKNVSQHIWIGVGPFIVNSVLGGLIAGPSAIAALNFEAGTVIDYFLVWLGVSIAMHAFPSTGDAKSIWRAVWGRKSSVLVRLLATPLVGLIYLGAIGSFFWLDVAYGFAVAMSVPFLLVMLLG